MENLLQKLTLFVLVAVTIALSWNTLKTDHELKNLNEKVIKMQQQIEVLEQKSNQGVLEQGQELFEKFKDSLDKFSDKINN